MTTESLPVRKDVHAEYAELRARIGASEKPDLRDIDRMCRLILHNRELWGCASAMMEGVRHQVIEAVTDEISRKTIQTEVQVLYQQLGYHRSSELERLLIDHVVTARIRLIYAERMVNVHMIRAQVRIGEAIFWDRLMTTAHARYLRAMETLARVRRLSRSGPLLQVNIANAGSQQMNVQGELFAVTGRVSPHAQNPGS